MQRLHRRSIAAAFGAISAGAESMRQTVKPPMNAMGMEALALRPLFW
jgi:hypothetical protein